MAESETLTSDPSDGFHGLPAVEKLRVTSFDEEDRTRPALRDWLTRPPEERIVAVEFLRRQVDLDVLISQTSTP
jgi:hypothetical protein